MRKSQALKLMALHEDGYRILITDHHYVDSFARAILELGEEDIEKDSTDTVGSVVYSSQVFHHRPLTSVDISCVEVYKEVANRGKINKFINDDSVPVDEVP